MFMGSNIKLWFLIIFYISGEHQKFTRENNNKLLILFVIQLVNPVYVGLAESNVLTETNKVLSVRASDLLGRPVEVSVVLESLTDSSGKKVADIQFLQAVQSSDKYVIQFSCFNACESCMGINF